MKEFSFSIKMRKKSSHFNISVRQKGAVREDLPVDEKLMVINEPSVRAPATSSISGLHNIYPYQYANLNGNMLWMHKEK